MRVGDLLEWVAGGLATAASLLATHLIWPALVTGALFLAYQAQCYGSHPLPRPTIKRRKSAGPQPAARRRTRDHGLRVITTREEAWKS